MCETSLDGENEFFESENEEAVRSTVSREGTNDDDDAAEKGRKEPGKRPF